MLAALVWSGPRANSVGFGHGVTAWTYLVNQAQIVVDVPDPCRVAEPAVLDYGPPLPLGLSQVALHAALLTALTLAVGYSWRKTPRVAFLGTVALVTLAPTSSIIPIATEVGAERRMDLPPCSTRGAVRRRGGRRAATGASCGTSPFAPRRCRPPAPGGGEPGGSRVASRCRIQRPRPIVEWRPDAPASRPRSLQPRGHPPRTCDRAGAIDHYRQALADFPDAHYAVGYELEVDDRHDEAITHLREFIERDRTTSTYREPRS